MDVKKHLRTVIKQPHFGKMDKTYKLACVKFQSIQEKYAQTDTAFIW